MRNDLPFAIRSIVMNESQSKQVTGCSNLVMVLDLHETTLQVSNPILKAHLYHVNLNPLQYIHEKL